MHTSEGFNTELAISKDAGGRNRTSQMTTLFDGKCLNTDDTNIWETVGTGTSSLLDNKYNMNVTIGQYIIRQSLRSLPYFSGKSQLVEFTFDNFQSQAGVTKRVGYFTSNAEQPYDSNKDGFWLESTPTTITFNVQNNGTNIATLPLTEFNGGALVNYDWSKFTIMLIDYLWLGGSEVRIFIKLDDGFVLSHTFKHAAFNNGTFMRSPNQRIRYEIRSTTGSGSMNAICSQVASEGSSDECGKPTSIFNILPITCNTVGTIYALKSIKKLAQERDIPIEILDFGASIVTSDSGLLMILISPTLSAPIVYTTNSKFEEGTPTNQTVTNKNKVLKCIPVTSGSMSIAANDKSFLNFLPSTINNTMIEYVLAYMPVTPNQTVHGVLNVKEY